MSTSEHRALMLGLKGAGKTSFLAALWHMSESPNTDIRMRASALHDDREYLNRIRNRWLSFEQVGRTSMRSGEKYLRMLLRDKSTDEEVELSLPDVSGEMYRQQWTERTATTSYVQYTRSADGVLLFVHPHFFDPSPRIEPNPDVSASAEDEDVPPEDKAVQWNPKDASTQVQLVDLLQILARIREPDVAIPVAVIVSAWDQVQGSITPIHWLARRAPLLDQFLAARTDAFSSTVFGVSALGGDLERDAARLEQIPTPKERVQVVTEGGVHHDITEPVAWMLDSRRRGRSN